MAAATMCWPGAMSVRVHGLWQSGLPSKVICAPAGTDDTVSCASAGATTAAWVLLRPWRSSSGVRFFLFHGQRRLMLNRRRGVSRPQAGQALGQPPLGGVCFGCAICAGAVPRRFPAVVIFQIIVHCHCADNDDNERNRSAHSVQDKAWAGSYEFRQRLFVQLRGPGSSASPELSLRSQAGPASIGGTSSVAEARRNRWHIRFFQRRKLFELREAGLVGGNRSRFIRLGHHRIYAESRVELEASRPPELPASEGRRRSC